MTPAWAQRREELLNDCLVSPDVFTSMVERLGDFVVPYQRALETEVGQRNVPLYLEGLLSHLGRKNAEEIATFVHVERQVLQDFIGTAPWDHQPLVKWPIAWASPRASSRSIPAVSPNAARTRWASNGSGVATGGRSTIARSASSWATSLRTIMPCSTSGCPCPRTGHATSHDARHATSRQRCATKRVRSSVWRCSTRGVIRCLMAG